MVSKSSKHTNGRLATIREYYSKRKQTTTFRAYLQRTHPLTGKRSLKYGPARVNKDESINDYDLLLQDWNQEMALLDHTLSNKMKFYAYMEHYVAEGRSEDAGKAPRTAEQWRHTVKVVTEKMPDVRLDKVRFSDIRKLYQELAKGHDSGPDSSAMRRIVHVVAALKGAVDEGLLSKTPIPFDYADKLMGSRVARRNQESRDNRDKADKQLTSIQMRQLRTKLLGLVMRQEDFKQLTAMVGLILMQTGIRPEEVQGLTTDAIRWNKDHTMMCFFVDQSFDDRHHKMNDGTKTGVFHQSTYLNPQFSKLISDYIKLRNDFLEAKGFTQHIDKAPIIVNLVGKKYLELGRPITQAAMTKQLKSLLNSDVSLYYIRHTIINEMVRMVTDGNYADVAYLQGTSIDMLMRRYVHPQMETSAELAERFGHESVV